MADRDRIKDGRFKEALDARGADLARWPERERAHAEALLRESDAARAALREAEAFERLLMDAVPDAPRERLRRNILAALPMPGTGADASPSARIGQGAAAAAGGWSFRWLWAGGLGAAAASMALSFYLGTAVPTVWPDEVAEAETQTADDLSDDFDSMLFGLGFNEDVT